MLPPVRATTSAPPTTPSAVRGTVPAAARCEVDLRYLTPEDGDALFRDLERLATGSAIGGTSIALERSSSRPRSHSWNAKCSGR